MHFPFDSSILLSLFFLFLVFIYTHTYIYIVSYFICICIKKYEKSVPFIQNMSYCIQSKSLRTKKFYICIIVLSNIYSIIISSFFTSSHCVVFYLNRYKNVFCHWKKMFIRLFDLIFYLWLFYKDKMLTILFLKWIQHS